MLQRPGLELGLPVKQRSPQTVDSAGAPVGEPVRRLRRRHPAAARGQDDAAVADAGALSPLGEQVLVAVGSAGQMPIGTIE